jgi:UDP-2-acetamido-3-amino-2,3-dideoxy-glucuronate N-acetyltransferase
VKIVHDVDEIILDEELDGIVIASSPETHYGLARKCLECGHNLFVEKPMCTDINEAQILFELAQASKLKVMVGFVYLYSSEYSRIKQNSRETDLIEAHFMKTKSRHDIPCMINLGSHFVALSLDFYEQNPTTLSLEGDADDAVIDISFPDGKARIYASYRSESPQRDVLFIRERETICRWDINNIDYHTDNPLKNECKHFVDYLQNDVEPKTDALLGLKVAKLVGGVLP